MSPDDRERIAAALQDQTKSYRAIGRDLGVSDWVVRKVAREVDGDMRPMRSPQSPSDEPIQEVSTLTSWLVFGGFIACIALVIWAGSRWNPPPAS